MGFSVTSATVINRSGMLSLKPATGYVFVSADIRVIPNRIHSIPYRYRCCMEQAIGAVTISDSAFDSGAILG